MLRDNLVHGLGNRGHQRMRAGREGRQLSLLEPERPRNEKRERLEQSLDAIRRKYGKTSIAPGNVIKNDIGLEDIEIEEKP